MKLTISYVAALVVIGVLTINLSLCNLINMNSMDESIIDITQGQILLA